MLVCTERETSHVVFQTNFPSDMNLVFPKGPFTQFLDSVFGGGKVMSDGIDISQVTGQLKTYSYFGPKGKDNRPALLAGPPSKIRLTSAPRLVCCTARPKTGCPVFIPAAP